MDCPEPLRWMGLAMVGKKRMRVWSCGGHVGERENVVPTTRQEEAP
jgi:hypothetical protein